MDRRQARDLHRYTPRVVSDWHAGNQRWQEVDGSLVFVDISGFTSLSERLTAFGRIGAEELTGVLNHVFGAMLDLGYERGGSLLKFGGDALLFLFIGPDHAMHACAAAVEMRTALRLASRQPTSVGRLRLRLSVGVHSGGILLFRVGSFHTELVVAGPGASTTTEMERTAAAGEVVISTATRALLPAGAATTAKGSGWLLRWRRAPIPAIGAVGRQTTSSQGSLQLLPVALRRFLQDGDAEPEHRVASIAFVRFSGLDAVLRDRGPQAGWQVLDVLMVAVQAAVDSEGATFLGTDIDADGGKIILASGVPAMVEDGEGRILRVARRIADGHTDLRVQIGANCGHVYAGEIGTPYRCTYTVMGDTVNLAARLMAAAGPDEVLAAPSVLDGARTIFAVTALEPLSVRGKSQPVHAYSVGAEVGARDTESTRDGPFHGRAREVSAVRGALERRADNGGAVITVVGDAGMGKSRLVDEVLAGLPELSCFSVRGEPYASEVAYRALRYPFRRLLGLEDVEAGEMPARLSRAVGALGPELLPYLPLVADVVHVDVAPTPEVTAIDRRFRSTRRAEVIEDVLAAALSAPSALVVDDAHWLDDASAELLARLAAAGERRGWSMVVLRREEAGGFHPGGGPTVSLAPLPDRDSEALVLAATTAAPLRPNELAAIIDRAGGNPLYLLELVRAVRASGGLSELPDSLDATLAVQIDRLAPLPRRILRFAAVLGRTFPVRVFEEVLAAGQLELDAATEAHLAGFLARSGALELRFLHALMQEVAYRGLSYGRRRELHALAGDAIERLNSANPDRAADVLGLHYQRGQRHAEAWRYARLAGDAAARAHANAEAVGHYERALAAARRLPGLTNRERADVWVQLGDAREQCGIFDLALDAYRRAARLVVGDPVTAASMSLKRARARERSGAYPLALAEITAGLRRLEDVDPVSVAPLRARLLVFRAVVRQGQGRMAEALAVAGEAAEAARAAGEDAALASAYGVIDWVHLAMGELDQVRLGEAALGIYEGLGDLEGQGKVMNTMGAVAYYRGAWDEAIEWYGRAQEIGLRTGNHVQAAISAMNVGETLVNQSRFDEAEPLLHHAIRVFRASAYLDGQALAETYLGRSLLGRGHLDDAEKVLGEARERFEAAGVFGGALEAAAHLADCWVRRGEPGAALRLLDTAVSRASGDADVLAATVARVQASALASAGRLAEAIERLAKGLAAARHQRLAYEERLLLELQAELGTVPV